jgi:hypothetical protein
MALSQRAPMTDNFLRKLAEECVSASYRSTDVEAATKLLEVATELLKHVAEPEQPRSPELATASQQSHPAHSQGHVH